LQRRIYRRVDADLGPDAREVETAHHLLWLHYMDALFYAARGQRALARDATAAALVLDPDDVQLRALQQALARGDGEGPLDVQRFLALDVH
jgi:hypothetical protein